MSIAPMRRLTLCGPRREKDAVIEGLQGLGCVHLVPLVEAGPLAPPDAATRRRAEAAWRHLDTAPRRLRPWPPARAVDPACAVSATLANKARLRELGERRDFLAARIAGLRPFGDFTLPPLDRLRGRRLWFYVLPVRERRTLEALDLPWAVVGRTATALHVAVIACEEPPRDLLAVPRTHTGARQLSHLEGNLAETEIEIERAEAERAELTRHRLALGLDLARAADADDRRAAAAMTRDDDRLFALAGWAPAEAAERLTEFVRRRGLALQLDPPGPAAAPPTLLETPEGYEGAAALTRFYMTPGYRSWDPSLIVFASFAAFFAMILADAGYAALLGLGLLGASPRLRRTGQGRRLLKMLGVILAAAAGYGVLAGSYFGLAPPEGSLPAALDMIDMEDFDTMMAVSVIIGVAHVSIANLQVAWRNRGGVRVAKLGWVGATVSGLMIWLAPSPIWYATLALSLAAVFVGAGLDRPVRRPLDWLRRAADGALGLTQVTRLFGDVLSYMRLFALGLASGALAGTFNEIAGRMAAEVPGGGVALALLVLVFGHAINLALGVLSGVVHGLRLNFIEFLGWGLTQEGYPFKPFAQRESAS